MGIMDWVLPIRSDVFCLVGIVLMVVIASRFSSKARSRPDSDRRKKWLWWPLAFLFWAVTVFEMVWAIYSYNQGLEVERTIDYEVKVVIFPDGKQIQMFTEDGEYKNANKLFACQVPEGHVVRRFIHKRTYCGIYYPPYASSSIKDNYLLVDPKKGE